ncbi:MAG: formate dehydrogenase subunit gamma [Gammaproteobacteria bacterium]|nr:formate dehydrogenase subunit gamma [Gammaproteobacteria bacterium]
MKTQTLCIKYETMMKFITALLIILFISLPQSSFAEVDPLQQGISNKNPGSDLWRAVRQRTVQIQGVSQVKTVDSNILINPQADKWTRFRINELTNFGLILLGSVLALILVFFLLRGKVNIDGGLSGNMVFRFNDYERVLHWVLALVFLFLALTGLTLLFGRTLLIPVFGHEVFSLLASSSKEAHNLFGPIFIVSLLLMLIRFVKKNIYAKGDLTWLLKGGGMVGKSHVTGGFFNMGEKSWYWLVILVGLGISVTGLILLFPNFGQGRILMELSHILHVIGALALIAVSFGHMYLGSVGTEGTNESMKSGYVDIKWAEAHHDRWAKHCHDNDLIVSADEFAKLKGASNSPLNSVSSSVAELNK